jgi:hypothetical protein
MHMRAIANDEVRFGKAGDEFDYRRARVSQKQKLFASRNARTKRDAYRHFMARMQSIARADSANFPGPHRKAASTLRT